MSIKIKQSSTGRALVFLMVDDTDHITGKTGLSPTVTIRKEGGSFASPAGSVTEIGNGWYQVAGNATDTNTLGSLLLHATATGADPVDLMFEVVAYDPGDAAGLGLSRIDVAVSSRAEPGDEMDLIDTPNSDAVTAIQAGLSTYDGSDTSGTTTLLSRVPDTISLAAINAQVDTALADYDGPTNAEMVAAFTEIKGAGWSSGTDTLEKIADSIAGGGVDPATIATAVWSSGTRTLTAFTFDVTVASGSVSAIQSGLATSAEIASLESHGDSTWATATGFLTGSEAIESGVTLLQAQKAILASAAGVLEGALTSQITIKNPAGTADRITADVDGDGNRTSITLSLS